MVATSRHHGLPAHPDSKDGLQGALFNMWTPDPRHKPHQANTTHLEFTAVNQLQACRVPAPLVLGTVRS